MMKLDKHGNFEPWVQPNYGYDAYDNQIIAEDGWYILPRLTKILDGDKPFDVYSGWVICDGWHARTGKVACSDGRWVAWERKM